MLNKEFLEHCKGAEISPSHRQMITNLKKYGRIGITIMGYKYGKSLINRARQAEKERILEEMSRSEIIEMLRSYDFTENTGLQEDYVKYFNFLYGDITAGRVFLEGVVHDYVFGF